MKYDLSGNVYGRLTVISIAGKDKYGNCLWNCHCECGNDCVTKGYLLRAGKTKSCGCWKRDLPSKMFKTHGLRQHPLYTVWVDMRYRCEKKDSERFYRYGGRGIKVCDEWQDFKCFYDWAISAGYEKGLTIDRIDNDGDYEPNNCRWVDRYVQGNNKSNNRVLCIDGETKNLFQWCKQYNIHPTTVINRIKRGWSVKDAVTKPIKRKGVK